MRTFIAIALPDEVRRLVAQLQEPLAEIHGVRLMRPEQCHLTLKFLGGIDEAQCAAILSALGEIRQTAFQLSLTALGAFPNATRPRVIWIGVSNSPQLERLAQAVDLATSAIAQDRPFRPHITMARIGAGSARIEPGALEMPVPPCSFSVREFAFYRTVLGPAGSKHEMLREFALVA